MDDTRIALGLSATGASSADIRLSPPLRDALSSLTVDAGGTAGRALLALRERVPEYGPGLSSQVSAEVYSHCLMVTRGWYRALHDGSPQPADERALMQIGTYKCRHGFTLGALMQAFRVGSMVLWCELIRLGDREPAVQSELLSTVSVFFLRYFDTVGRLVSHGYQSEQEVLWPDSLPTPGPVMVERLTERESTVLELLRQGCSNRDIARRLFLSENTVKFHLKNVYAKLGVRSRAAAIISARRLHG